MKIFIMALMLGGILIVLPTSQTQAQSISLRNSPKGCNQEMYPQRWRCGMCFSTQWCDFARTTSCGTCYTLEDNSQDPGYVRIKLFDENGNPLFTIYADTYTETQGSNFIEITWNEVPDRNW